MAQMYIDDKKIGCYTDIHKATDCATVANVCNY